jgi:hypothetical protein
MAEESAADAAQCTLSQEEIQHLADAFNFLYHGLKEAQQRFANLAAQDGGRDGAIHALEYVIKFFTCLEQTGVYPLIVRDGVHAPLARLFDDLMSLDNGMVSAMLLPKKKRGRARASGAYDGLKGIAVFTVRRLASTGVSLPEARKMVASKLAEQDVRPARKGSMHGSGLFSERTLRKWQEDIGFNDTSTDTLTRLEGAHVKEVLGGLGLSALPTGLTADDLLLQNQSIPVADLRRAYLDQLTAFVASTRGQETT